MISIPQHFLSACADKVDVCMGDCDEPVKQDAATGRWFVTMGHPGFNSAANNGRGFKTKLKAVESVRWFAARRSSGPTVR